MIKSIILRSIGEKNAGRLEYFLRPQLKASWGPLNGQSVRQSVYSDIISRIDFRAIVETGTFYGATTEFFTKSGLPVYSVEIHPRAYGYSLQRFSCKRDQVHIFQGSSPEFLRDLAGNPNFPKSKVFFYLDAHVQDSSTYHKAPLLEELEIIFTEWTEVVVMVDDFQVPGTNYGFDNWGLDRSLNLAFLEPLKYLRLSAFFPALGPEHETGGRRGWVLLCREDTISQILSGTCNLSCVVNSSSPHLDHSSPRTD